MNDSLKNEFFEYIGVIKALSDALTLMDWDASTGAPKDGAALKAKNMGIISGQLYSLSTSEKMAELLKNLELEKNSLDEITKSMYRECKEEYDKSHKIPKELVMEFSEASAISAKVWEEAKTKNDYEMFAPHLNKMIQYKKRMSEYISDGRTLYDTLLNEYEKDLTARTLDKYFSDLRENIVPLLKKVQSSKKSIDDSFLKIPVPKENQKKISALIMQIIGYDLDRGILRESEHPFSTSFNKFDCRITTHYHEDYHTASLYSVLHECGHALYEQGCGDEIAGTVLDHGISMAIHESQSRFYENIIGRSSEFVDIIFDKLSALLGPDFKHVTPKKYFEAVNISKPSLIRIEADELTYSLHIMLRYEMEKMFIDGDYDIKKLPGIWNNMVRDYLGIEVTSDKEGILQDTHWSNGLFGYFPAYSLGSAYSAQFLDSMQKEFDVYKAVESRDISKITGWLREKIHRFGSIKLPYEIIQNACGEPFDSAYYVNYLTKKFTKLYEL